VQSKFIPSTDADSKLTWWNNLLKIGYIQLHISSQNAHFAFIFTISGFLVDKMVVLGSLAYQDFTIKY